VKIGANDASGKMLQSALQNVRQNNFFEEITGIRSQVPAIFIENSEVVLGDFNQFIFFTWCCKWAQMVHLAKSYK
jgi:hypothetical protein